MAIRVVIPEQIDANLYPPDHSIRYPVMTGPDMYPGNRIMALIPLSASICSGDSEYASASIMIGSDESVHTKYPKRNPTDDKPMFVVAYGHKNCTTEMHINESIVRC